MFGRQQGQDCYWYARELILHLPALFPQPLAERAGRVGKKLLEDLPALLMMTHRKDVSQAAIPFQGVPQLLCLGLGQEDRPTTMCRRQKNLTHMFHVQNGAWLGFQTEQPRCELLQRVYLVMRHY